MITFPRSCPLAALLTIALSFASRLPAAGPVNLLTNGGFEEGTAGWEPSPKHELTSEPNAAHTGKACLTGEVQKPNQALILRRKVPVRAGNRYEFEIYARATNGTKLVLWATLPGNDKRQMISGWDNVSKRWQRYTTSIPVSVDGALELQIVAPSSNAAPPGRIWIDDIALYEIPIPPALNASRDEGFNDEPALARTASGDTYLAWNSFRDGHDTLQLARLAMDGKTTQTGQTWTIAGDKDFYTLGLRVVGTDDAAYLLYAAERNRQWDIYAVRCDTAGPGRPMAVTTSAGVNVNPAAAWHRGTLWIAWESNRGGSRQIFAAPLRDDKVGPAVAVSEPDVSSYDPAIAVLSNGEVCVAWHSFRDNNYDIWLRRGLAVGNSPAAGNWPAAVRLTKAPTVDRHAVLAARGEELWLVYENAQSKQYHVGATIRRHLVVARVEDDALKAPKTHGKSPLDEPCEGATAAFDAAGRLWIAYLTPGSDHHKGWFPKVTCLAGDRWMPPVQLAWQKGMDRAPGLAVAGRRVIAAWQSDDRPNMWKSVDESTQSKSNVFTASIDASDAPVAEPMTVESLVETAEPYEAGEMRVARGEDTPTPTIDYSGRRLKLFFGDLHHHTDISPCNRTGDQSVEEGYQHMRDINRLDFACATDHGYAINAYLWNYMAKMARVNDDSNRFLTFLAEEWTSTFKEQSVEHPYGFYGHRNLILADTYFPQWWNAQNRQTPAQLWEDLRKLNASFVNIPHQLADTGNVPCDWNFTNETAQPVAEIFQTRGSYEYQGTPREAVNAVPKPGYFIQDAWARGIVIGVIAAPDHGGGYGKACVFAPELSRPAILEALHARHCYGTTAAKIFLDVRVADHLMGDKIAAAATAPVSVQVSTRCPADIERIDVCRNNRFIYTAQPPGREARFEFADREPLAGRSYYYVRVIQKDGEIAWSSPVWFGAP